MKKAMCMLGQLFMPIAMAMGGNLLNGLVGYWPFDGNANDISGNGNNGMIHGVTLTTDRHGNSDNAYHFDGKSWIEVANSRSLHNITAEITIAAWIKPTSWSYQTDEGDKWLTVLQKGSSSNHYEFQYGRWAKEGVSYVSLDYWNGAFIKNKSVNIPSLGVWQFVAITLSAGKLKSYKNGVLQDSLNVGVALVPNGSSLYIGANPVGDCEYFIGTMDNVAIYNRALSASEIKALSKFVPTTLEIRTVSFNPNVGLGEMEDDVFEEGKEQKLSRNTYIKVGYVFQGWAESKVDADKGVVKYQDEALITVDHDMTLYAVWANPALTLVAESADWSEGSITLRCEDSDTSGAEHEYTLEYKNASGAWEEVDGAKNKVATKGQDANGQEVLIAKLTDEAFWSRLGGIQPVEYRVKDENGRVSEGCVTRNRFLLSVGYSKFLTKNTPKRGHYNDASEIKSLCVNRGEFLPENARFRSNADATTEKVRGEMSYFATRTKPGDVFVFYIATHGGGYDSKHNASLATYDGGYQVKDLLDDVRAFPSGVAVVNIIMSCHSFALTGSVNASERINQWLVACGFGQCLGNVAWVTSCDAQQSSYTYLDEDHSRFGQSFIVNGFGQGCADMKLYGTEYGGGDKDGFITIGELGRYSKEFFKGLSEDMPSSVQLENDGLIDRIVLGRRTGDVAWSCPETPSSINASQGDMKIDISWARVGNATSYRIYRYPLDLPSEFKWVGISGESRYKDETATLKKEYGYRIRAVNPIGVSDLSSVAIGSRGTSEFIEFLNSFFGITTASADEYDAMEKTTAANGCRTVGECYALGIDPEDPDDDLKISEFKMKDGKPEITLNHTKDGSGNSFEDRIKVFGKARLTDGEWQEVPPDGNPEHRFFRVGVELP